LCHYDVLLLCSHANEKIAQLGTYNVITMDGSVDRRTARNTVSTGTGGAVALQGNYDPAELIEANGKTAESVRSTAIQLSQELGPRNLIANLGEGLGGKESPELVKIFVDTIHDESEKMIVATSGEGV